jgi:hypothetical protein
MAKPVSDSDNLEGGGNREASFYEVFVSLMSLVGNPPLRQGRLMRGIDSHKAQKSASSP